MSLPLNPTPISDNCTYFKIIFGCKVTETGSHLRLRYEFTKYLPIFFEICVVGSKRRTRFETEGIMALQGHPRSLILAPIENAYATYY